MRVHLARTLLFSLILTAFAHGTPVHLRCEQELLRHADIRTTMNVYAQAVSEQKRAAHSKVVQMVLSA